MKIEIERELHGAVLTFSTYPNFPTFQQNFLNINYHNFEHILEYPHFFNKLIIITKKNIRHF